MIPVEDAQTMCLELVRTGHSETIALADALGRTLAAPVQAKRDQPPFSASAMDGYAVCEVAQGDVLDVIGESAAGHGWDGTVAQGQAVRIFTGAPVPNGATRVVIQENVSLEGDRVTLVEPINLGTNIRPQGADFSSDFTLDAPRVLSAADLALIAAMNHPEISVARRPKVALISTGDELLMPGGDPAPDQIIASNVFALQAMLQDAGAKPNVLPIARDTPEALDTVLQQARDWGADIVVTIGGASVGDHDLVAPALDRFGVTRSFHKIAMRPGKPLMAGSKGDVAFLGLPGNPVSAVVCGHLFLLPLVRRALGQVDVLPRILTAKLDAPLPKGGPRAHYMRARFHEGPDARHVIGFDRQDSSMLTVLADANCLMLSPIGSAAKETGDSVTILPI
ncbi:molybdopterin molybdotransferase MoeA [Octadecabacter sp. 1_MG-2023]|uniref:molybdopterin molybdotransferase MoeA n=1 Tax=unclassified Octadecabacter TaxID=196158 RepID=UPI001C0872C3|nr:MULTISPECIES: gephyrin-like molybdotransferase Glp [unclassified Octadecabacter]MBU2993443.1 molybdopterin molybdotransferase MoeA [Octadecabacter sp. B2R22]MDO6733101.1 molybdopterin molybdotransferase MoeA [Octadecabacter sp. 1_MG-2023]